MAELRRVEIGFKGGEAVAVRLGEEALEKLRGALGSREGWHLVEAEDDELSLDLGQIAFVRVHGTGPAIGFGGR